MRPVSSCKWSQDNLQISQNINVLHCTNYGIARKTFMGDGVKLLWHNSSYTESVRTGPVLTPVVRKRKKPRQSNKWSVFTEIERRIA